MADFKDGDILQHAIDWMHNNLDPDDVFDESDIQDCAVDISFAYTN